MNERESSPSRARRLRIGAYDIVHDAGGVIAGQTRLQKMAYLLELTGLGAGFRFRHGYYGPYSLDLDAAIREAVVLRLLTEEELPTVWGGYSVYRVIPTTERGLTRPRSELLSVAAGIDSIDLVLVSTALYLHTDGCLDPWGRAARLHTAIASAGIESARDAYLRILDVPVPRHLPRILGACTEAIAGGICPT